MSALSSRATIIGLLLILLILILFVMWLPQSAETSVDEPTNQVYLPHLVTARDFSFIPTPDGATTFAFITDIRTVGDERLFVAEQEGFIQVINPDGTVSQYLDLTDRVISVADRDWEQGLLGFVFHPDFATNGYLFVMYVENGFHYSNDDVILSRFTVSAETGLVDLNSELVLLNLDKTTDLHNGGSLAFSPLDNYLYVGVGDDTVMENAQDLTTIKGKILRLDVDNGTPYAIPPDNPFVGSPDSRGEIWASGLRNPWRMSIDPASGDLYIGDVGWNYWEEIDFQPGTSAGGENYGWPCYEATHETGLLPDTCNALESHQEPIHEYFHTLGCSVIGGYVYRGNQAQWHGDYFFGDLCGRTISALRQDTNGRWTSEPVGVAPPGYIMSTFGVNGNGELFIGAHQNTATLYEIMLP